MILSHLRSDDPLGLGDRGRARGAGTVSDPRIVPAIELLRKEEPGAFVVRDSSSFRGSFGLALKVQEAPAPAQNRSGMHPSLSSPLSSLKASLRQGGVVGSGPSSAAGLPGVLGPGLQ